MKCQLLLTLLLGAMAISSGMAHECLRDATRDDAGVCQCPNKLVGDGNFCCAGNGFDMCQLKGDPRLKSISGDMAKVNYPCTHSVAEIKDKFQGKMCSLRVFTTGAIVEEGFIRAYEVVIQITVTNNSPKTVNIKVNTFIDPLTGQEIDITTNPGSHLFDIDGVPFELSFDTNDMMWSLSGCHSVVRYRAPLGTTAQQSKVPGVCLLSRKGKSTGSVDDGNLCSLDSAFDKGMHQSIAHRLLAKNMLSHAGLTDDEKIDSDSMAAACDGIDGFFRDCNTFQKPEALRECGDMMISHEVRRNFDGANPGVFQVFCDCIAAFCSKSQEACDRLKSNTNVQNFYPRATECDTWIMPPMTSKK